MQRHWWGGRTTAFATIGGFLVGIPGLVALEIQNGWFNDHWDQFYPYSQFGGLIIIVLLLLVMLIGQHRSFHRNDVQAIDVVITSERLGADRSLFRELLLLLPSDGRSMSLGESTDSMVCTMELT